MVKLGFSFSGNAGKEIGGQDGAAMDCTPLISPLDVSQLQPSFSDQVVIKTQTDYQLTSSDQPKKFSDLEGQRLAGQTEEGRRVPTARMIAFAMALMGCVLIMYKAIWYDQFSCPDGFLLRHKICTPLTLEMYYTEMDTDSQDRHRNILAALGAYPVNRKHATEMPAPALWGNSYRASKEERKGPTPAAVVVSTAAAAAAGTEPSGIEPSGKPSAMREEGDPPKTEGMPSQAP
ncbi:neuron-specific vesicular protein calcyon [Onychomys torridus]|uniref:neuron-specific vesicular protein calcyon n=1 Tax=Onychomys torridus TaxID=38674 RepID=UPI00167F2193|nr:neuron-specific vesicular protein calcyon [Onychomys torridus]XP_036061515.1 neuron-specific vesicular protein calcyon [Onychomys torridus]